mmetsp:Transcript_28115/g.47772  ORF Transcript_28115/g.47772 Transcript_28115/m.47772 type:complete len:214 (-) Transcript_28115:1042-1683(-)
MHAKVSSTFQKSTPSLKLLLRLIRIFLAAATAANTLATWFRLTFMACLHAHGINLSRSIPDVAILSCHPILRHHSLILMEEEMAMLHHMPRKLIRLETYLDSKEALRWRGETRVKVSGRNPRLAESSRELQGILPIAHLIPIGDNILNHYIKVARINLGDLERVDVLMVRMEGHAEELHFIDRSSGEFINVGVHIHPRSEGTVSFAGVGLFAK